MNTANDLTQPLSRDVNSNESGNNVDDLGDASLPEKPVGQESHHDERSLERLYSELTGASEAQARSVFIHLFVEGVKFSAGDNQHI